MSIPYSLWIKYKQLLTKNHIGHNFLLSYIHIQVFDHLYKQCNPTPLVRTNPRTVSKDTLQLYITVDFKPSLSRTPTVTLM